MSYQVQRELAVLESMTATQLRGRYRELFGEDSRTGNRQWLFRRCAWRVQALAEGDLAERIARIREQSLRVANDADIRTMAPRISEPNPVAPCQITKMVIRQRGRLPPTGTVLERPFKGNTHVVKVLGDGFEYENRIYKSLTAVAHAISGSHWNGFHFFRDQLNHKQRKEIKNG